MITIQVKCYTVPRAKLCCHKGLSAIIILWQHDSQTQPVHRPCARASTGLVYYTVGGLVATIMMNQRRRGAAAAWGLGH
jgi:hypothetical protein